MSSLFPKLPKDVVGYGIFRQSASGIPDQEAAVPLSGVYAASSNLIYDDTSFLTAVSIVNPSSVSTTVGITVRDEQGKVLATSSLPLDARCKKAAFLRELPGMGSIAGHRGSVDFVVTTGNIAVLGLRFGGAAFTTIQTTEK